MEFTVEAKFNSSAKAIYTAWLSSQEHARMTGGEATISDHIGDSFSTWDGYIEGKNIELIPNQKIVQSWRTSQFDTDQDDSIVTITLTEENEMTALVLVHSNLTDKDYHYKQGWIDHYFEPMKAYFGG